jgi:hypothetical protein
MNTSVTDERASNAIFTICPHRFAVRRPDAKYGGNQDVLEARHEEDCRIFKVGRLELIALLGRIWGSRIPWPHFRNCSCNWHGYQHSPWLPSYPKVSPDLDSSRNENLANNAGEDLPRHQVRSRSFVINPGVWQRSCHYRINEVSPCSAAR